MATSGCRKRKTHITSGTGPCGLTFTFCFAQCIELSHPRARNEELLWLGAELRTEDGGRLVGEFVSERDEVFGSERQMQYGSSIGDCSGNRLAFGPVPPVDIQDRSSLLSQRARHDKTSRMIEILEERNHFPAGLRIIRQERFKDIVP